MSERTDYDGPHPGDAYVIRVESASGRRLETVVRDKDVRGGEAARDMARQLGELARVLAENLFVADGLATRVQLGYERQELDSRQEIWVRDV